MRKFVEIVVVLMLLISCFIPATGTSDLSSLKIQNKSVETLKKVTIYINTSAIDDRNDLNESQKNALKNRIIQHVKNNFEPAVGAENVSVTNDKSQEGSADRTVKVEPGKDPDQKDPAWGRWPYESNTTHVYLGEFMDDGKVNGSFKNPDGTWNTTALGNAIGHTAGHEVGHSCSVGHNNESRPKKFAQDNRSKMTNGSNINASERANASYPFDNHSRDILTGNWGKPPCDSAPDYDLKILGADYYASPMPTSDKDDEYGTLDAMFHGITAYPGWYELGFLGIDTDHGLIDGNPEFDFVYKSSLWMNELDATFISFLKGHQDKTTWLIRSTEISPEPNKWYILNPENVFLGNYILQPDGDEVAQLVTMVWPEQMVNIIFDTFNYEHTRQNFNGFTYQLYLQSPPSAPNITGETSGKKGKSYAYDFESWDLQGDKLYYFIDWGDNTTKDWFGPYYSEEIVTASHTWNKKGTYTISIKAKDYYGSESTWGYLEVTMPRTASSSFLSRLSKLFPYAFSMLRHLMEY